jgi:hypothetical protein
MYAFISKKIDILRQNTDIFAEKQKVLMLRKYVL